MRALAIVCAAIALSPARSSAHDRVLIEGLRARAITDEDFVVRDLYSWTTREQTHRIRREERLLWASASDGAVRAPYQRALDRMMRRRGVEGAIARMLTEHPVLARRRYAWTTPYGTVVPHGDRSYGPVLLHVRLRRDVWIGRFAPEETPALRFVDAENREVPPSSVLRHPSRLAAIYHVRSRAELGPFREIVVHNEAAIERFSFATPRLRSRVDEDVRLVRRMLAYRRGTRAPLPSNLVPFWRTASEDPTALFAATMPFDDPRHRPSDASLNAIARALRTTHARVPGYIATR